MADSIITIDVVCAVIKANNKILCVQRSDKMKLPLKWEFPGGKIHSGETERIALIREIKEELNVEISIIKRLTPNHHIYDNKLGIQLIPFYCKIVNGTIELTEHLQYCWLSSSKLESLDWAEADLPIIKQIETLEP